MGTYLGTSLDRLAQFAPTVLGVFVLIAVVQFARAWRMTLWQDRLFGIIDENHKGGAPLHVTLSMAATSLLPLPILNRWLDTWMDRHYGASETLTLDQRRGYVGEMFNSAKRDVEVHWWSVILVLLLAPLREELLFRAILLLFFPSLTAWSLIAITASALGFGAVHWKGQVTIVMEELRAWGENRISRVSRSQRIIATSSTFVLGLLCGVAAVYYQNLWVAIAIHAGWNYLIPRLSMILAVYWLRGKLITNRRVWIP